MIELDVPAQRQELVTRVARRLIDAERLVLTTHVNADGDGTGSQAAIAAWLAGQGRQVTIINPTPYPDTFRFLFEDPSIILSHGSAAADRAIRDMDLLVVLDTAEPSRIGRLAKPAAAADVVIIDHHVTAASEITGLKLQDASAGATGELVFDILQTAGLPRPWNRQVTSGIYTAIVTDTGSFRFANTTSRIHMIAADLIRQGVDPEQMYRHIYAAVPLHRLRLLQHALENLDVDEQAPITSISITHEAMERLGAGSEDLEGLVEHARSIAGTEVAILFRETSDGATKVSLRAAGDTDVNAIAREFGGGGHIKASGALIPEPLDTARHRVLEAVRAALR